MADLRITLGKTVNLTILEQAIKALGLPGYRTLKALSRERIGGALVNVPQYLLLNSDPLTGPQRASVQTEITNHVVPPRPPPPTVTDITSAATLGDLKTALAKRFG